MNLSPISAHAPLMLVMVPSNFGSSKGRMEAAFQLFWLPGRLRPVADIVDRREQHFLPRPWSHPAKLPDPQTAFRLPKGLLASVDAICEQQDLTRSQL
jgi:hypothetical protein